MKFSKNELLIKSLKSKLVESQPKSYRRSWRPFWKYIQNIFHMELLKYYFFVQDYLDMYYIHTWLII